MRGANTIRTSHFREELRFSPEETPSRKEYFNMQKSHVEERVLYE